jgi:hypothetical protein
MNFNRLMAILILICSTQIEAKVYKCGSPGLSVEINDMDKKISIALSSGVSSLDVQKSYRLLGIEIGMSNSGLNATIKQPKKYGSIAKNRNGFKLNCTPIQCRSLDGVQLIIDFKDIPNHYTPKIIMTDRVPGTPIESYGSENSAFAEIIYRFSGMEVTIFDNGTAAYSENKSKGPFGPAKTLKMTCK